MDSGRVYLRHNVCVRPLVARWNATEQLIPPIQAALNAKNVQIELLESYVASPEYHWKAARTPSLSGGPWVDVQPSQALGVERFLDAMRTRQKERLALAGDVEALDKMLREHARGGSLTPLYKKVPERLRGYVELGYDASHQPSARYIESLLYRSPHHDPSLQSIALSLIDSDRRVPQFTTPLLEEDLALCLRAPFAHEGVDALFAMKTSPRPFGEIRELLGVRGGEVEQLRALFTEEAPAPARRPSIPGVRVRYFGHACVLFETNDVSLLVDPVVSYDYPGGPPRLTYRDLPEQLDYVVLTHFHKDHLNLETLLQLRCRTARFIIPKNGSGAVQDPSFRLMLESIGFRNIIELDRLESLPLPGGEITALPFLGEHADLDIQSKSAYLIRLEGRSTLCAADSANVEPALYGHLHPFTGDIDALFLGMECVGAPLTTTYGGILLKPLPRSFDQERRTIGSDYEGAMEIIDRMRPEQVYIYAMGLEPWLGHLLPVEPNRDALGVKESDRVVAECRRRGLTASRPYCEMEIVLPPDPGAS